MDDILQKFTSLRRHLWSTTTTTAYPGCAHDNMMGFDNLPKFSTVILESTGHGVALASGEGNLGQLPLLLNLQTLTSYNLCCFCENTQKFTLAFGTCIIDSWTPKNRKNFRLRQMRLILGWFCLFFIKTGWEQTYPWNCNALQSSTNHKITVCLKTPNFSSAFKATADCFVVNPVNHNNSR